MISSVNKRDPLLFTEVRSIQKRRISAKIAYEHLMNEIISRLPLKFVNYNKRINEMLLFSQTCFDQDELIDHTVSFFVYHGFESKMILDSIEKFRFELRLLEDDELEDCYEEVAIYLEYLIEVYSKIKDIAQIYKDEMFYLQN